jgi:ferritin-like metal-binding protein YciE
MKSTNEKSRENNTPKHTKENTEKTKSDAAQQGLRGLFLDELKDMYWAEKSIAKMLPKMLKNASGSELLKALPTFIDMNNKHLIRVEEVFSAIHEKATAKKCKAMEGLALEAEEVMGNTKKGMIRDVAIILTAQKINYYEMVTYDTLCSLAKTLGEKDAFDLLHKTLREEKEQEQQMAIISAKLIKEVAEVIEGKEKEEETELSRILNEA